MLPKLGEKYDIDIEVPPKAKAGYLTDDNFALDLPVAQAIMVGDEIVVEGSDIDQYKVESVICRCLGLPEPQRVQPGFIARILGI